MELDGVVTIYVMVMMKNLKILGLAAVIFFSPAFLLAGDQTTETFMPDLLTDDYLDEDEFYDENEFIISDPLEPMNRVFYTFNDKLYEWALKPVSDGYSWLIPKDIRVSFGNFFFNLAMPIRLLNSLLQADFEGAGIVLSRFVINTTLGIYGLADVASAEFDIRPQEADFGQTLGKWGVGQGIYFCWPLFGPSSVRESVGLVVDAYTHPIPYVHENRVLDLAYYTSNKLNTLSLNPDLYDDLKRYSLDPYVAARQAFYEYRRAVVERD